MGKKSKEAKLSTALLWDYDLPDFDWEGMKVMVVQRIIERGWFEDFYAGFRIYGGIENFRSIIKQIPILTPKEISFVCMVFDLKKQDLKCYTFKQLRAKRIYS